MSFPRTLPWKTGVLPGSVLKCLTRNPGVLGSSRTGSSRFFMRVSKKDINNVSCCCHMTEVLLKAAYNTIQSINQSINRSINRLIDLWKTKWIQWGSYPGPVACESYTSLSSFAGPLISRLLPTVEFNPFPNKPWFLPVFFPQCFLPVWRTLYHFHQIWNCRLQTLWVWQSLKFVVWERVKQSLHVGSKSKLHVVCSPSLMLSLDHAIPTQERSL